MAIEETNMGGWHKGIVVGFILAAVTILASLAMAQSVFRFGSLSRGNPLHYAMLTSAGVATPLGISAKDQYVKIVGLTPEEGPGWEYDPISGELKASGEGAEGIYDTKVSALIWMMAGAASKVAVVPHRNGVEMEECTLWLGFPAGLGEYEETGSACNVVVNRGDIFTFYGVNLSNAQDFTVESYRVVAHRL
jgi:hypothetical protein